MPLIFLFLLILGIAQLLSTGWHLRALSLVGPNHLMGFGLGLLLIAFGVIGLQGAPVGWSVLGWLILIIPLVVVILVLTGSFIWPPPHPNTLFTPDHSAHSSLTALQIPDGDSTIPALLLRPPVDQQTGAAVCLAHGSGDHKTSFKWRLIRALLAEGLTVWTIDLPGHGE
jgi:hypothetical protein